MQVNDDIIVHDETGMPFAHATIIKINQNDIEISTHANLYRLAQTLTVKPTQLKPLTQFQPGDTVEVCYANKAFAKGVVEEDECLKYQENVLVKITEIVNIPIDFFTINLKVGETTSFYNFRLKLTTSTQPKICTCNLWAGCTCGVFHEEMKCKQMKQ